MVRLSTAPLRALRARPAAQAAGRFVAPAVTRSFHISSPRSNAASTAAKAPAAGAGLQGNIDFMTGEVIRTADIDVSDSFSLISLRLFRALLVRSTCREGVSVTTKAPLRKPRSTSSEARESYEEQISTFRLADSFENGALASSFTDC